MTFLSGNYYWIALGPFLGAG